MLDVAIHPEVRAERLDLSRLHRGRPRLRRAAASAAAPAPATQPAPAGARRRGRGGPPSPPSMTVFVRGKINKNNEWVEEQVHLSCSARAVHAQRLALRHALPVRQGQDISSTRSASAATMTNAQDLSKPLGKIHRVNDDGIDSEGQPVREHAERAAVDLDATGIATRRAWRGIRSPACSGNPSTARPAATRSTSSRKARTTAGA